LRCPLEQNPFAWFATLSLWQYFATKLAKKNKPTLDAIIEIIITIRRE
jgi:hypothetical protein